MIYIPILSSKREAIKQIFEVPIPDQNFQCIGYNYSFLCYELKQFNFFVR
jgi:hypothetical protein